MRSSSILICLTAVAVAVLASQANALTTQTGDHVFDGHPYLWVEGESFASLTGPEETGWKVVTKGGPDLSFVTAGNEGIQRQILPEDSNVSGSAIWAQTNQGDSHAHAAHYELQFITPGTYQFYLRMSLYDSNGDGTFGNEDSIYLPPTFNMNSGTDWIGFEGLQFDENDLNVNLPEPGFALDPAGYVPETGDSARDGLHELAFLWPIKDAGVVTQHNATGTLAANGNFNWYNKPTNQGWTAALAFDGFYGMKVEYEVTEEMVGETVNFEIGTREVNVVIDGFMFIQVDGLFIAEGDTRVNNDLLDLHSQADLDAAILPQALEGDYNGDGSVDAADYTVIIDQDLGTDAYNTWVANFGNPGSAAGNAAIPEPSALGLLLVGLGLLVARLRR